MIGAGGFTNTNIQKEGDNSWFEGNKGRHCDLCVGYRREWLTARGNPGKSTREVKLRALDFWGGIRKSESGRTEAEGQTGQKDQRESLIENGYTSQGTVQRRSLEKQFGIWLLNAQKAGERSLDFMLKVLRKRWQLKLESDKIWCARHRNITLVTVYKRVD